MQLDSSTVLLAGPTAAGKTDLAVALVERFPFEIISVDSALVYRGMDIGTAKPDAATLARAPHRLIDILDPAEAYSAAQFRADALREMAAIRARGRVPLLVGGTMLYFRALTEGLSELPPADTQVRAALEAELARDGLAALHRRLAESDPEAAARIHPNDPQRTLRALEVLVVSGVPLSELHRRGRVAPLLGPRVELVVAPGDRQLLHRRIEQRFHAMLEAGFVGEVEGLRARPDLHPALPSMRAVGYRQVWEYLDGGCDYPTMVARGMAATRQYAKRQLTWLRAGEGRVWLDAQHAGILDAAVAALREAGCLPAD